MSYKCEICNSKPDQLSHHKSHLKTGKHKDKRVIFELELKAMPQPELEEVYHTTDIAEIVNARETVEVKEEIGIVKKHISGEEIWCLQLNKETNENYKTIKAQLDSVIKKCHDLLYSQGGSIVGSKAQNDIMRVLCLKILQSQFQDKTSKLYQKCLGVKDKYNIKEFEIYMLFCKDLNEMTKKDDIMKEWRFFIQKFISKVFPSIYFENDEKFNCDKKDCITDLIKCIHNLDISDAFKDAFSTTCGDIHESFRSYGGGKGAKELGQYFTPRHLIHLIFHGIGLDSMLKNIDSIYDPCMGTGGFLTRLFKMSNINPENIYGCETEIDTIKFGNMSMVLTTGSVDNHIIKCDSLCENPFIVDKKFSAIVTNPPFGTKMKYDDLKKIFKEKITTIQFEDVYPIKTNNGACLFIQHCVYMLEENGVCAIVLPDGELFEGNSKWSKEFRKWWVENANIQTILKVPSGTFEHAGVKTNVVVFTKNKPTEHIHFVETTKECNVVRDMFTITMDELKMTNYSLDVGEYVVEEKVLYDVPMVSLGEVCELQNGTQLDKKNIIIGEYPVFGGGKKNVGNHDKFNRTGGEVIVCGTGSCGFVQRYLKPYWASQCFTIKSIKSNLSSDYLYYLSKYLLETTFMNSTKGGGQPYIRGIQFTNLKIPLPSPEVQQQIVDELSLLDTSIQTIETRLSQLKMEKDQYKKYGRKAEIRDLLKDSKEVALGEVCEIEGNIKKYDTSYGKSEGKYKFHTGGERTDLYVDNCDITDLYIIQNRTNGSGKCNLFIDRNFSLAKQTIVYKAKTDDTTKYLYYYLLYNKEIIEKGFIGANHKNISKHYISKIKIPLPSLEVQQQCIELFEQKEAFLQRIDDKIAEEKKYMDTLKQLAKDVISSHC